MSRFLSENARKKRVSQTKYVYGLLIYSEHLQQGLPLLIITVIMSSVIEKWTHH